MFGKSGVVLYLCIIVVCLLFDYCMCSRSSSSGNILTRNGNKAKTKRSPNDTTNPRSLCASDSCTCENISESPQIKLNCSFKSDEIVEIFPGSIPYKSREIILSGGHTISLSSRSFTNLEDPALISLSKFREAVIGKHAFLNLTANHPNIQINECETLILETGAFKNTGGPPSINISNCNHTVLRGEAFSRLQILTISNVPELEIHENAFTLELMVKKQRHGDFTKIILNNITTSVFPKKTFGSSVDEIRLQDIRVRDVRADAFSATSYNTVIAIDSSFAKLYQEAFSQKTHIYKKLELFNCSIGSLATGAIQSSSTILSIKHNTVTQVATGAINITVAQVYIEDNVFGQIHTNGFTFNDWNNINMDNNVFSRLGTDPIVVVFDDMTSKNNSLAFTFIKNGIFGMTQGSLKFISDVQAVLPKLVYEKTYFDELCVCEIESWLGSVFGKNSSFLEHVSDNSYCAVRNPVLVKCYNLFHEHMLVRNFTIMTCTKEPQLKCLPSITKKTGIANDIENTKFLNKKNEIREAEETEIMNNYLVRIAAIAISVLIVIIILLIIIRRSCHGFPIRNTGVCSNNCCVIICDRMCNGHYGSDTAGSISRLSVHEYNESHRLNETRVTDLENREVEEEQLLENEVPGIDKATQTLPEELTKELLESLREKLDDPDNYSEAREMIEHLYDLIKVEESCNSNNNVPSGSAAKDYGDQEDNLYDVIQVPVKRKGKNNKIMVSVGTKVPSLEKLTEFSPYMRPTALCHEYFEPRDRAMHLYAELPGDHNSDMSQMPDVVGERTSRPLSFLRAIGEKIQPNYNPTAPVGSVRSIDSATRMANRPLPEKPKEAGEGTSFQRH